ncbi:MAG: aminopeptidase [Bacilli bacterium]|nr:aminopeptidase [Bacilli bacterium]
MNERLKKLSSTIVNYSLKVKADDRILITVSTTKANEFINYLIKDIVKNKGIPFVRIIDSEINSLLLENTNDNRIKEIKKHNEFDVENYDCFINIRYSTNDFENNEIDKEIRKKIGAATKESDAIRINKKRWVLLNYPSRLDAFKANMKTEKFMDFSLNAMNIDYSKMYDDVKPLKELMEKTKNVRIIGPDTDITFSINKMPSIPCCGKYNIPDGEIYTAPEKYSVNGIITYNTKSPYQGYVFENVSLKFKDGKIIEATASSNNEKLNEIFDTDEGARYIGEFAIGLNPAIKNPMGDILFDEKIIGSIHFTPGQAYYDAYNGNDSSIHWDLVLIQRKEYGGGEIYFDHQLIRKDGLFVLPELKHLNYEKK